MPVGLLTLLTLLTHSPSMRNQNERIYKMEENLVELIKGYEVTESCNRSSIPNSTGADDTRPVEAPAAKGADTVETEIEEQSRDLIYEIRDGHLFKVTGGKDTRVANFYLTIAAQYIRMDEGTVTGRDFKIEVHLRDEIIELMIPVEEFCGNRLANQIIAQAGSRAIIYGNQNDLRIAAQEMSTPPTKTITSSMGFDNHGMYLAPGMVISKAGIDQLPEIEVDLSEGNFSRHIGFLSPNQDRIKDLVDHILADFMQLKYHQVVYPLIGHIVAAAFASQISEIGRQKPVMHLQGTSGCGKTFLGNLAASFYCAFNDRPIPWTSTANSIEYEGYFFRDALFFIDDLKTSIIDPKKVIRIIQNSANSQGRSRLTAGGGLKLTPMRGVRGLILSTGEDFINDVESVSGRTLLIHVEPDQNQQSGNKCWARRDEYSMLMPALLQWLLAQDDWTEQFENCVNEETARISATIADFSNGFRVASNWALNAWGFMLFVRYAEHLQVVNEGRADAIIREYRQIVENHIAAHANRIRIQSPVEVFYQILSQRFATGSIMVQGLSDQNSGRLIGKVRENQIICLFPDPTFEVLQRHFRASGRKMSFSKETLRDALDRENLIIRSGPGRITHQVRMGASRLQAWQFDINEFKARCGMMD